MENIILEVCIDSVQSAVAAQKGGAARVELCDNLFEGGTTPSAGCIEITRKYIDIDLNVIIRPRGGDFCYSDIEFEVMKKDIEVAKSLGVDGVVIGILNPDGTVDMERNSKLIDLARPMSVTFHRAFDMTSDPFSTLEEVIKLGCDRLLTSGQEHTAFEGAELIAQMVEQAKDRIIIMPGAGITNRNIQKIRKITQANEFHSSGRSQANSKMQYQKNGVFMGGDLRMPEFTNSFVDTNKINAILKSE